MKKKYHFISGLPRSGSTLLSSILKQNPRFHSSISDPVCTLVKGIIETLGNEPGMKSEVSTERRRNIINGVFEGYYKNVDKEIIFNTNRAWTLLTPLVKELHPTAKIIVCVRDINWILDSFETIHRKNPFTTSTVLGHHSHSNSVYERVDGLMETRGVVGFPYLGLKQAITSAEKNMLMLVEYNDLCKDPEKIMRSLYNFIDEPYYEHDFDNVENSWDEYDSEIGVNFHRIRKKVEYTPRNFILPPDILQKYANMEVWRLP